MSKEISYSTNRTDRAFEQDIESVLPFREHWLQLSEKQRQAKMNSLLGNTRIKIAMKPETPEHKDYWEKVIEEADKRVAAAR